jgi:hypothetical protein
MHCRAPPAGPYQGLTPYRCTTREGACTHVAVAVVMHLYQQDLRLPQYVSRSTSPAARLPPHVSRRMSPAVRLPQHVSRRTSPAVCPPVHQKDLANRRNRYVNCGVKWA